MKSSCERKIFFFKMNTFPLLIFSLAVSHWALGRLTGTRLPFASQVSYPHTVNIRLCASCCIVLYPSETDQKAICHQIPAVKMSVMLLNWSPNEIFKSNCLLSFFFTLIVNGFEKPELHLYLRAE